MKLTLNFNKIFVSFLLLLSSIAHAQYIEIEEHYTEEELVKDIFLGTNSAACIDVSNISVKGGNFGTYHKSYGYFNANGSSFPIEEGLILSTGKAESAKGPNSYILQESASNWLGDSDLEDALHISSTHNATILEFDFISHNTNRISFDYMFSSEQYLSYPQSYQCDYTDGFAFLIKKAGSTDRYENIAVIPNTDIPVAVNTIRGRSLNGNCPAQNEQYFGGFNDNDHPTNFNGQTKVLTAQSEIEPGVKYHIKLVIADQGNPLYDSAVFLKAGSFTGQKNLGPNRMIADGNALCANQTLTLDAAVAGATSYQWFLNGSPISGANQSEYSVTGPGNYSVEIDDNGCLIKGSIIIEYYSDAAITTKTFMNCDVNFDELIPVDFNTISPQIITHSGSYTIKYYLDEVDAQNGASNNLPNNWNYSSNTTVYVRAENSYCDPVFGSINFEVGEKISVIRVEITDEICDPEIDGTAETDLSVYENLFSTEAGVHFQYFDSETKAQNNLGAIAPTLSFSGTKTFYVRIEKSGLCPEIVSVTLTVKSSEISSVLENKIVCPGQSTVLDAGLGYDSYEWNTGETSSSISAGVGEYFVDLEKNGCVYRQHVTVSEAQPPVITNIEISGNTAVVFVTEESAPYLFSLDGINFQPSNTFTNLPRGLHTMYVKGADDCAVATEQFVIINLINLITPNGDGYNDELNYEDLKIKNNVTIKVFDRFGNTVHSGNENTLKWDGKSFGKPLPTGTYWYVISWTEPAIGEIKTYHGWVLLKNRN